MDLRNESLKGKEFQDIVKQRGLEYSRFQLAHMVEYGVQCVRTDDKVLEISSLPDFDGVTAGGRQFVFDCKVCSQASFDLSPYRQDTRAPKARQLKHLRTRAAYNVPAFFLIHWNARSLATMSEPAETYVFPVCQNEFWEQFDAAEVRSIKRRDCERFGVRVEWNIIGQARTYRPDFFVPVLARIETGSWPERSL